MKKIALVDMLFNWPPDGGARTDVKEIACRLGRYADVRLFVPQFETLSPRGRVLEDPGVAVEKIPFTVPTFHYPEIGNRLRSAVDRFQPDIVLIADAWYLKPRLFRALRHHRPWVRFYAYEGLCLRAHGLFMRRGRLCPHRFVQGGMTNFLRCQWCAVTRTLSLLFYHEYLIAAAFSPFYGDHLRAMLQTASGVIVYNDFIAGQIRPYNCNVRIIPSGVDAARFTPAEPPARDHLALGMVGRWSDPAKGFHCLDRACARLREEGLNFRLHLTGDVDRVVPRPYVTPHPWLTQTELPEFYREIDVAIVPSIWPEPFGIVALEAMASGKPLIATRVGGLQCIVVEGETGLLVDPGDVSGMASAIRQLAGDRQLRLRMGQAGRQRAVEHYDWERIVERYYRPMWGI